MNNVYRWFRAVIVAVILVAVGIPAILFIYLSIPSVQKKIREGTENELSKILDSDIRIRDIAISPFNRLTLFGVSATDVNGDETVTIERIGAGLSLSDFIFFGRFVVNYMELIGLDAKITRTDPHGEFNISNIINAVKPKDEQKEKRAFELSVNTIILRNIDVQYDVLSEPKPLPGRFNRFHIDIENLRADISLPLLSNNVYAADVYRLAFEERSGFIMSNLHGRLYFSPEELTVSGLGIELPASTLSFHDLRLDFTEPGNLLDAVSQNTISFMIEEGSTLTPADVSCFFPPLSNFTKPIDLTLNLEGNADRLNLKPLYLNSVGSNLMVIVEGEAHNLLRNDSRALDLTKLLIRTDGRQTSMFLPETVSAKVKEIVANVGDFTFEGIAKVDDSKAVSDGTLRAEAGQVSFDIKASFNSENEHYLPLEFDVEGSVLDLNLQRILSNPELGDVTASFGAHGNVKRNKEINADGNLLVKSFVFRDYVYSDVDVLANVEGDEITVKAETSHSREIDLSMLAIFSLPQKKEKMFNVNIDLRALDPEELKLVKNFPGERLRGHLDAGFRWNNVDDIIGEAHVSDLRMTDRDGTDYDLVRHLGLKVEGEPLDRLVTLRSDRLDFQLNGTLHPLSIIDNLKSISSNLLPALFTEKKHKTEASLNDFKFNAIVKETEDIADLFRLPVSTLSKLSIDGSLNSRVGVASLNVDAPYLRQGNKLIEKSRLSLDVSPNGGLLSMDTSTPTKDGLMDISIDNVMSVDTVKTFATWKINRARNYSGNLSFLTSLSQMESEQGNARMLVADVDLLPGRLEFNDSIWTIHPSRVSVMGKDRIDVDNLLVTRGDQFVKIGGVVSQNPADILRLDLSEVNLDYIFESLGIDKAQIGGDATGYFEASSLLSGAPHLDTPGLFVKGISYNQTVLGDAIVNSRWDNENQSITLGANIEQPNKRHTTIDGAIFPLNDSLDISFNANKVNIAFLRPYMEAFTPEVQGEASGKARLWGNFKYIDLEGNLMADSIRMKIDFTNSWYSASDSVIIYPGLIDLKNIQLRDDEGHTALLNGFVRHIYFKEPSFEFNITDARNFLVFDETEYRNPRWYGHVFANGSAMVKGAPGIVEISCDMTTAPGSTFTFVLSDMEEAGEYSFITFRDRDYLMIKDSLQLIDPTPVLVRSFRERMAKIEESGLSRYDMSFNVNINPNLQMILVMDPIGGDRIRAYGTGNMRIEYGSTDEELRMYGAYTLERGSYNFTLQDIIIKDFTIRDGSSITFRGDPYAAQLDITAVYSLTANISDLDASFLEDRDVSRTNVPVHALLHVTGDLQQPDISFDLEFPTLTQDTYRKVRSIISTEDMMNRQIIYLLALNRFYTPDYMQSTTKGNELVSVASSTLSSQLSSILGQISDNWTIAPNIRSERGDFSDVEMDLALSSALLNNRLLFNGNFGYRDKLMNTNQFVGDFDIEYLLNRSGSIRLKAYNRYNDRNFYIKTATTTQGVGVMFKHDFDSFLNFLNKYKK
ncbi:MAG: translocation/assembly module TamB [Muribaculaceae bacterium]|nr:translocation/assembly module TamB [Muribaculaceae bacterium]